MAVPVRYFNFAIFLAATMFAPVLACTGKVLPTPANYTGLCGCSAPYLPILQAPGIPCPSFAYGCMTPGENVTDGSNCTNPNAMKAGTWLLGDRSLGGSGWMDSTYLECLDCPTMTTTATAAVTTSALVAALTLTASATTTAAAASTLRAATTNAATTTSQAQTTSTASAITSTYAQATSLGAGAVVAATTSVVTTAPSESLSPSPVRIDGFVSVTGPWTATAITIFSAVNTSTSGLARLTVDGSVKIQQGASATIELSEDLIAPKRLRLILATSISGDFDSISIRAATKKGGCVKAKYHVKSVAMATMLAVDVSSETEKSCPTHRAWLIGVIVFASVFGVGVIIAIVCVSMERWKPEWSYLSRRRAGSSSYYDANAY